MISDPRAGQDKVGINIERRRGGKDDQIDVDESCFIIFDGYYRD